jgi:hypothetical protein
MLSDVLLFIGEVIALLGLIAFIIWLLIILVKHSYD